MQVKVTTRADYKIFFIKANTYKIQLLDIGASIYRLMTKNASGRFEDIVLYHTDPQAYFHNDGYYGTTIGRNAGRIANGTFILNGKQHHLPKNDGKNNLHSSGKGLSQRIMRSQVDRQGTQIKITFSLQLTEADDGFPGQIEIQVVYVFDKNYFTIYYVAVASEDTICNITNHSYFNLSGNNQNDIRNLMLKNTFKAVYQMSSQSVPTHLVPSTQIFSKPWNSVAELETTNHSFFKAENGLDHVFELNQQRQIEIYDPLSKRQVQIQTSYPYVVLYAQNFPTVSHQAKQGLAIEPQFVPNEINTKKSHYQTILKQGQQYRHQIKYTFN